ncbi:hypothetical protein A3H38_03635 [candidate division WOR-1 bacterium RIFCSPLOWO2_02_FULL_46_20]|uniref:General secretion pathway GspH domain-containing protein n=2 Tax=Saganbacteria TaxID=1703751 RepID=A0A1F4R4K6_UNCSA|nr:MAG: hypothetical protein A3J44_00485 [candidate division WOR-1 bacterium RIFCSPHIGHO2_02_FULL_45_12]OGC03117.1 MAG: hypothetical protein A3H38_03635 [candidate division WOR-1 bacterium RIFCSPLOWO2_02_FULL_46_20]OGC08060.1 MAG: hypothetical protein A3F86_01620 [candidate division WOR-1 bacterium RIFCSPLOWO2_12_FULL_45_9]
MKPRGFTLVELLVVLSVLAVMAAISLPGFYAFSAQISLNASAKTMASSLRKLQGQAILQHETLTFNLTDLKLPKGISPIKTSNICFAPSGFTPPGGSGTFIIKNNIGQTKMIVVSTSGRVRVE